MSKNVVVLGLVSIFFFFSQIAAESDVIRIREGQTHIKLKFRNQSGQRLDGVSILADSRSIPSWLEFTPLQISSLAPDEEVEIFLKLPKIDISGYGITEIPLILSDIKGRRWTSLMKIMPKKNPEVLIHSVSPNPFNPSTTISYNIAGISDQVTTVQIYSLEGQLVKTLVNTILNPGQHSVVWRGKDDMGREVGSGIYILRLQTNSLSDIRKITLLK